MRVVASADRALLYAAVIGDSGGQRWLDLSRSVDGGVSWGTRRRFATFADRFSSGSNDLVVSSSGQRAVISWVDYSGAVLPQGGLARVLRVAATADAGLSWSAPRQISTSGLSAYTAKLAASADLSQITAVAGNQGAAQGFQTLTATSLDGGLTWPRVATARGLDDFATTSDGSVLVSAWRGGEQWAEQVFVSRSTDRGLSWSAAQPITPVMLQVSSIRLALSADGSTFAVLWTEAQSFSESSLRVSRSRDQGASWSGPLQIAEGGCSVCALGVSSDGNRLTTVWSGFDADRRQVFASSSLGAGLAWTAPVALASAGGDIGGNIGGLRLGMSPDGRQVHALWARDNDAHISAQRASSADAGVDWSPARDLGPVEPAAFNARIAISEDTRRAFVLWTARLENVIKLRVSSSGDGGESWIVRELPGADRDYADVDMSADGGVGLIIRSNRAGDDIEVAIERSADGGLTWDIPVRLASQETFSTRPVVRVSADGSKALAVWASSSGSLRGWLSSRSLDGGVSWSLPVPALAQENLFDSAQLELSDDGSRALLVARFADGIYSRLVSAQSVDGGASWTSEAVVSEPGVSAQQFELRASSDGLSAVIAWAQSAPSNREVINAVGTTNGGVSWSTVAALGGRNFTNDELQLAGGGQSAWNVLWETNQGLQLARSQDNGSTWAAPFDPGLQRSNFASAPLMKASEDGRNLTLVWTDFTSPNNRLMAASSTTAGATWTVPVTVASSQRDVRSQQFVLSADGARALIVWTSVGEGSNNLQMSTGSGLDLPIFAGGFEAP